MFLVPEHCKANGLVLVPLDSTKASIFHLRATRTKESSDNDINDGNFKTVNTTSPKKKYSHRFIGA